MKKLGQREKISIYSDLDFAYSQLDSAISLFKRKQWGISEGYLRSVESEVKNIEKKLIQTLK